MEVRGSCAADTDRLPLEGLSAFGGGLEDLKIGPSAIPLHVCQSVRKFWPRTYADRFWPHRKAVPRLRRPIFWPRSRQRYSDLGRALRVSRIPTGHFWDANQILEH